MIWGGINERILSHKGIRVLERKGAMWKGPKSRGQNVLMEEWGEDPGHLLDDI